MASMECKATPAATPERNIRCQIKETNTNAQQNQSVVIESVNESGTHQHEARSTRLFVAPLLVLFVILLMISAWVELEGIAENSGAVVSTPAAAESVPRVEYFPSGYVNQATETTEHIQAF
jgi:hypothetical protein